MLILNYSSSDIQPYSPSSQRILNPPLLSELLFYIIIHHIASWRLFLDIPFQGGRIQSRISAATHRSGDRSPSKRLNPVCVVIHSGTDRRAHYFAVSQADNAACRNVPSVVDFGLRDYFFCPVDGTLDPLEEMMLFR